MNKSNENGTMIKLSSVRGARDEVNWDVPIALFDLYPYPILRYTHAHLIWTQAWTLSDSF